MPGGTLQDRHDSIPQLVTHFGHKVWRSNHVVEDTLERLDRPGRIRIKFGPPYEVGADFGPGNEREKLAELTRGLMERIAGLLEDLDREALEEYGERRNVYPLRRADS